jgi:stringent starvation protein B
MTDARTQVPREYVQNDQIVLNISSEATTSLTLDNDFIRFRARFGGVARNIIIPVDRVMAIYAKENGQGMAFPNESSAEIADDDSADLDDEDSQSDKKLGPITPKALSSIRLVTSSSESTDNKEVKDSQDEKNDDDPPPTPPRPALKRVK